MLESLLHVVIGASATVGYLSLWNRILRVTAPGTAPDDEAAQRRLRQRRRFAQLVLFVLLTPYVLIVFRLMDWVSQFTAPSAV